ncbi:MAG: SH3 domain-containing protein [Bacteroidota bacterium]
MNRSPIYFINIAFLKLFSFLVFLISLNSLAQNEKAVYYYGAFQEGAIVRLFSDKVNILSEPSISADSIFSLSAGAPLVIVNETDGSYKQNGVVANWYEVIYTEGSNEKSGFVWGGSLSLSSIEITGTNGSKGDIFIYGITAYDTLKNNFISEARIIRNNSLLSAVCFDAIYTAFVTNGEYGYTVESELMGCRDFKNTCNIIKITFTYEACAYTNGDVLLFWNGKELIYGAEAIDVSDAGAFSFKSEFVFPDETEKNDLLQKGEKNKLIIIETNLTLDSDNNITESKINKRIFKWTGTRLVEKRKKN